MTAINILPLRDAVYAFCDGASYDRNAVLLSVSSKVHVLGSISTIMMSSGRSIIMPYIAHHLERGASDFDDLRARVAEMLPTYVDELADLFGGDDHSPTDGESGFRLFFAGWSERDGPSAFTISNSVKDRRYPAYAVVDASKGKQSPGVSLDQATLGYGGPPQVNESNIENVALTTLELQRQQPWEDGKYYVGGHVEFVAVRRDRIEQRILHRWPEDRVGEMIKPQPVYWARWRLDHPVNVPITPIAATAKAQQHLNRQQRRALARGAHG